MEIDIESYNKNGYLVLKNFFNEGIIKTIKREAQELFRIQMLENDIPCESLNNCTDQEFSNRMFELFEKNFKTFTNTGKQVQHLLSLHRLALDSKLEYVVNKLGLTVPNISTRPVLFFNHPKLAKEEIYHTMGAHQDWRSMQGSLNSVVAWVPLMDINEELGAIKVLPGSHLKGLRTKKIVSGFGMVDLSTDEERRMVSVSVKISDLVIFSSFLIHQSGNNSTDVPRWSCHFRYNDMSDSTFIKRGFPHAYVYGPIDDLLTPNFPSIEEIKTAYI